MIGKKQILLLSINALQINAMHEIIVYKPISGVMTFSREEKQIIDRLPFIIEKIRKERAKEIKDHEYQKDHHTEPYSCHQSFQYSRDGTSKL